MKLLQVNCVYKKGSTGKIVYDIHSAMKKEEYQSVVCYGRGTKTIEADVYKTCREWYSKLNNLLSRFTGIMYGGCFLSTNQLIRIINREKPDIVHVHCINGYFVNIYRLISFLKKNKIPTVLTLHAEFMYTANCGHAFECNKWKTGCGNCPRFKKETKSIFFDHTHYSWKKMKKAFENFDELVVVSVSPWLQSRAEKAPILREQKHCTVLNGIDTSIFNVVSNSPLKQDMGWNHKKIIFHATAEFSTEPDHNKGGFYVVELAKRFLGKDDNVLFLVAGRCKKTDAIPSNVILLGNISDQNKLAEYYSIADVTLLTSRKETFSMVVAESLCCGTPIVGFEAGAPEMITIKEYSSFVPYGETDKLYHELESYLYFKEVDKNEISYISKKKFGKEEMIECYQKIYMDLMRK